ncbi:MAG TPA: hypothetical protein VLH10_20125, partial [Yinghuangia sp.]|nr:hypothetical protein [Yinghuangia sp.]
PQAFSHVPLIDTALRLTALWHQQQREAAVKAERRETATEAAEAAEAGGAAEPGTAERAHAAESGG